MRAVLKGLTGYNDLDAPWYLPGYDRRGKGWHPLTPECVHRSITLLNKPLQVLLKLPWACQSIDRLSSHRICKLDCIAPPVRSSNSRVEQRERQLQKLFITSAASAATHVPCVRRAAATKQRAKSARTARYNIFTVPLQYCSSHIIVFIICCKASSVDYTRHIDDTAFKIPPTVSSRGHNEGNEAQPKRLRDHIGYRHRLHSISPGRTGAREGLRDPNPIRDEIR